MVHPAREVFPEREERLAAGMAVLLPALAFRRGTELESDRRSIV